MDWLELVKACASVVSAAGIMVGVRQLMLQEEVWRTYHDRARKERAIEMIRFFNSTINDRSSATMKIVEKLDREQLQQLDSGKPFEVDLSFSNDLDAALKNGGFRKQGSKISLSGQDSYRLRFEALEFLNAVEIACQAWRLDVCEKTVIEQQMRFLYDPEEKEPRTFMRNYRREFDGDKYYPGIKLFTDYIDARRRSEQDGAKPSPPIVRPPKSV